MLQRIWALAIRAVVVAVIILGIPLAVLVPYAVWSTHSTAVTQRADMYAKVLDRSTGADDISIARRLAIVSGDDASYVVVATPDRTILRLGNRISAPTFHAYTFSATGATVNVWISAWPAISEAIGWFLLLVAGCVVAITVARNLSRKAAQKLAEPLISLAEQAEQVGIGNVSPRLRRSGISEIDMVQDALVRTSERMAGTIAAERQFAANASHQLRTPLTALTMRLEEIQYMTDDETVREEALKCLEQTERLTQVITDLMESSRGRNEDTACAVELQAIFEQQFDEWNGQFKRVNRELVFVGGEDITVLATPGALSQIIATLLENSLKYGAGRTVVEACKGNSERINLVYVSDEGEGIREELAPDIFEKGVSGHGSTGIGLALARDMARIDGARIELVKLSPPRFRITLAAYTQAQAAAVTASSSVVQPPLRRF